MCGISGGGILLAAKTPCGAQFYCATAREAGQCGEREGGKRMKSRREVLSMLLFTPAFSILGRGISLARGPKEAAGEERLAQHKVFSVQKKGYVMVDRVVKSDAEWKKQLTPEQYQILRRKGTERAFTGKYSNTHDQGIYRCAACGNDLFLSDTK